MNIRNTIVSLTVILIPVLWCGAEPKDILLSEGKTIPLPWVVTDGAGFTWDIHPPQGCVRHGTQYAYQGAMTLYPSRHQQFLVENPSGILGNHGRELQLGPRTFQSVRIRRRIYVDPKLGYARWIDVFENTSTKKPAGMNLRYETNLGQSIRRRRTGSGQTTPGPKDWSFVTCGENSSHPAVMHVFTSRRAKHRPGVQMQMNSTRILYQTSLTIPPGEIRALCFFEAQRNTFDEAVELMKTFHPERELMKVPKPLRDVIVNMSGDVLVLGRLDLPRSRKNDTIVMRDDSEVHGTVRNPSFPVETFFGKVNVPSDRVAGLAVLDPNDRFVQIALVDGQIVGGMLGKEGLKVRLADKKELSLPLHRVATMTYRISPEKPRTISPTGAMLVLRSGQRLRFDPAALPLEFLTEYGPVRLHPDDLCELRLAGDGRLHQAIFRNGSILTGLLRAEKVRSPLSLGPKLSVGRETLGAVLYHSPTGTGGPFRLSLRNDDVLLGNLAEKNLPIRTELGRIVVPTERVQSLRRLDGAPGRVAVRLLDDTTVNGTLQRPAIRFRITPDVELPVYVGHVVELRRGTHKETRKEKAQTQPSPSRK